MSLKVIAKPAFSNKYRNPYNYLLYSNLSATDECEIEEFTPRKVLAGHYDIFHIHWPEVMLLDRGIFRSVIVVILFLLLLKWMKLRGTCIVWTLHNLISHTHPYKNNINKRFERWYMNRFVRMLDGVIGLSATSLERAIVRYPVLSKKPVFVIPHGHYKEVYPNTTNRDIARKRLGLSRDSFVIGYFGKIHPYKNVSQLIKTYQELEDDNCDLLIAGNPTDKLLEEKICEMAGRSDHIKLILKFIPIEEVQYIFKASDLIVIPYKDILNSGSVLLALSFDVPVLVPDKGTLTELQGMVGSEWIQIYSEELTGEDLKRGIATVKERGPSVCESIKQFEWNTIAIQTLDAYHKIIQKNLE